MSTVYLNGEYLPQEEARVPVNDRGFLFGDGVYEVTPAYNGQFFRFGHHVCRMEGGLAALQIAYDTSNLKTIHDELLARNSLADREAAYVYIQVTRGVAPRTHAFPTAPVPPTVYAFAKEYRRPTRGVWERGYDAITVPDRRWSMVHIKSIALLPNVLAQQAAVDAGVSDSIFVRDGVALEGAHNNLFAVFDGVLTTAPKSNYILHGITRDFLIELAQSLDIAVVERSIPVEELMKADEVFFSGTTTEVRPTVRIDGADVGDGTVGPISRRLFEAFVRAVTAHGVGVPQAAP